MAFPAQPPDLRRLSFGRESFAFLCTLALLGNASYPVSVRRLDGFATPLLSALPSRKGALRLASVRTTKFREDLHLRTITHAGHTPRKPSALAGAGGFAATPAMTMKQMARRANDEEAPAEAVQNLRSRTAAGREAKRRAPCSHGPFVSALFRYSSRRSS